MYKSVSSTKVDWICSISSPFRKYSTPWELVSCCQVTSTPVPTIHPYLAHGCVCKYQRFLQMLVSKFILKPRWSGAVAMPLHQGT